MDAQTIAAYNADAARHAAFQRATDPGATSLRLAAGFFFPGAPTADIGCGAGRDAAWLELASFPTVGYEPSAAMRAEAQAHHPGLDVRAAALPDLAGVPDHAYANVLCNAVLMHLPATDMIGAALALARILCPGGRLILSFRGPRGAEEREPDGRLFTRIEPGRLVLLLESAGLAVLHRETSPDASRPGVLWHTLVAERGPLDVARGLERVQGVLAQDKKTATYKLALIRALCVIARTQPHLARWGAGSVEVPLWPIAVQWLIFYWPLLTSTPFIAQKNGEHPTTTQPIAFRATFDDLRDEHGPTGLYDLLAQLDADPQRFRARLRVIANTIRVGPVKHAGGGATPIFRHIRAERRPSRIEEAFGWVAMPEAVWLDISRFDHWIEDSIVVRWARITAEMNEANKENPGLYFGLLLQSPGAERDTTEIRRLLRVSGAPFECVWSGAQLTDTFHVDHVVPYAVWGNNDLWNLLPATGKLNDAKSDKLPTRAIIRRRADAITTYWHAYRGAMPQRFDTQISRALGCDPLHPGWEDRALAGLQETVERLATTRGLPRWEI